MRARHLLLLAYGLMIVFIVIGFIRVETLAEQLEEEALLRTHRLCVTQNETRSVIRGILTTLAEPRDGDEPGEQEQRERLLETVMPQIEELECPPPPPDNDRIPR